MLEYSGMLRGATCMVVCLVRYHAWPHPEVYEFAIWFPFLVSPPRPFSTSFPDLAYLVYQSSFSPGIFTRTSCKMHELHIFGQAPAFYHRPHVESTPGTVYPSPRYLKISHCFQFAFNDDAVFPKVGATGLFPSSTADTAVFYLSLSPSSTQQDCERSGT